MWVIRVEKKTYEQKMIEKGLKNTKNRKLVFEIIDKADNPITAEEIFLLLKEKGINSSLSTVYRVLDVFENNDFIIKSNSVDGKSRYELNSQEHRHHIVCTHCHRIQYIKECPFADIEARLKDTIGFNATGHKLEIYGECKECQKANKHY